MCFTLLWKDSFFFQSRFIEFCYQFELMSKPIKQNYLSRQNGCRIIQVSSQIEKGLGAHILTHDQKELWVVKAKLPQYCIIDTSNLKNYSKIFNRIGFYLWHQYGSNPALIQIAYSNNLSDDWTVAGKIRLQLKQDWQYFKIKEIPVTQMKRLKITLLENYGDSQTTYLNKVHLGYLKEETSLVQNNHRQKTFSEFIKLTSTEKQLKKAQDQIKRLVVENEEIKKTLKRQGDLIFQMQDAFKLVTKQLQKMQKIQQLQTQKQIIHDRKKEIDVLVEKNIKGKVNFGTHSSQSQTEKEEKQFIQDRMMNKKTVNLLKSKNNSYSYAKSQRNSYKKSRDEDYDQESRYKKGATIRQSRNQLPKKKSESQLSEYMASQHENCKSHYEENCKQMLVKLQVLMAERDKRQRQLQQKRK